MIEGSRTTPLWHVIPIVQQQLNDYLDAFPFSSCRSYRRQKCLVEVDLKMCGGDTRPDWRRD